MHTCFVFVSDKLAEEITLTIGQAFDLAYKRFLSGKTQESDKEKIARLERENAELSQRLKDVSNLVEPSKLSEYMKKNNVSFRLFFFKFNLISCLLQIKELVLVAERDILDNQESQEPRQTSNQETGPDVSEVSEDSAVDTQDKLISFDDPVHKLDHMTLDDLNDDDFDPRACDNTSDSSESDDFNPRSGPGFPAFSVATPPGPVSAPLSAPAKIQPPPHVPARDPAKIAGQKLPAPVMSNPFTAPAGNDAFGMSSFATGNDPKVIRSRSSHCVAFELIDLSMSGSVHSWSVWRGKFYPGPIGPLG